MIDHIGLLVSDFTTSCEFYRPVLEALGFGLVEEHAQSAGFGPPGMPLFWIYQGHAARSEVHVALRATDRAEVEAFYTAAMAAGAVSNGAPGLRPEYHANYYAAFVRDPDGNNLEAVCHQAAS
jgi:catechol 2,3-dioxygenase-like lactoylglutathione lyase family enzyme